jgi:hypothetical protein
VPSDCPERYGALIGRCWVQDPLARPSFADILRDLEAIHGDALASHKAETKKRKKEQRASEALDAGDMDIAQTAPGGARREKEGTSRSRTDKRATGIL